METQEQHGGASEEMVTDFQGLIVEDVPDTGHEDEDENEVVGTMGPETKTGNFIYNGNRLCFVARMCCT